MDNVNQNWTADEEQFLRQYFDIVDKQDIAKKLNRSVGAIKRKGEKLGLTKRKEVAKVGDIVKCWLITEIYIKDVGSQKISMAKVKSTIDDSESEYRLTLLTNEQIGYPDRRRPDNIKRNFSHGMSKTRLYSIWAGMRNRCTNKKQISYNNYGGRGITICDDWNLFVNFQQWAEKNGYNEILTLDRINVNGNYEPSNCKWSTWKQQSSNRQNNISDTIYNAFGESKTIYEWSNNDRCKVDLPALHYRLNAGWNVEKAITQPSERKAKQFNLQKFYSFVKDKHPDIIEEFMNT